MAEESNIKIISPHPGFQENFVRSNVDVVFGGGILGGGKDQPLDSKILTPEGWRRMGDMRIGSVISTPFNGATKVTGVFPQGVKDVFCVRTSDGRVCEAGLEHLWEVRTKKQLHKYREHHENRNFSVMTTREIMEGMARGAKYWIPLPKAQEFPEKEYVIHPYVLGVLIGDGCLTQRSVIRETVFTISNAEQDIVDKVARLTDTERTCAQLGNYNKVFYSPHSGEYLEYLRSVGLCDYSYKRFIPEEYLFGSAEQRRQLLYGLMDTDGSIDAKNRYSFSTTSGRLAEDFVYLCRSLGYKATVGIDGRSHKYTSGKAYDVRILTDDVIFSSAKHMARYGRNLEIYGPEHKYSRSNDHARIESIEYSRTAETQCIMVDDSDHLYITDDFITTHNTFGAILTTAEPSLDPNFRACFTRRTFGELKTGGGVVDDFESCFGDYADIKKTEPPRVTFPSGAFVEMRQINNEDSKKVIENWKGAQFDLIYMDELTSYLFSTFKYLLTRNRGKGKWTGKFRATTNPEKNCWIRKFIDWYIGLDGMIIPERDGVVRYFYINGDTVEDVVWGDSKEEVYDKARIDIDRKLRSLNKKGQRFTYSNLIKSFTFYLGNISENLTLLDGNMDYVGSVAAVGGKQSQQLIEGNWNVSSFDNEEAAIKSEDAQAVFMNDPQVNGDRWITADLADVGDDNTVILTWDGFHIIDIEIMCVSSPRQNAARLMATAAKHNIPLNHIIYDGTRAAYMNDYIPDAQAFISSHSPVGMYFMTVMSLKDECYLRLCELIKRGMLSISEAVARKRYQHVNLSQDYSIQVEFLDECSVVAFKVMYGGRKRLLSKKEMNQALGKGRSMDLLDPIAYRMLPCLEYEYGDELNKTAVWNMSEDEERGASEKVNVFDESVWC